MIVTTANSAFEPPDADSHEAEKNNFVEPRRTNNDPRDQGQRGGKPQRQNQPRRDKRDVHGWVVLDKPIGMTSTHAVAGSQDCFEPETGSTAGHRRLPCASAPSPAKDHRSSSSCSPVAAPAACSRMLARCAMILARSV
jgi:hypothetical protein